MENLVGALVAHTCQEVAIEPRAFGKWPPRFGHLGTRSLASPAACMGRGIAVAKTVLAAAPAKGSGSGPKNNCPTTVKIEAGKGARVGNITPEH